MTGPTLDIEREHQALYMEILSLSRIVNHQYFAMDPLKEIYIFKHRSGVSGLSAVSVDEALSISDNNWGVLSMRRVGVSSVPKLPLLFSLHLGYNGMSSDYNAWSSALSIEDSCGEDVEKMLAMYERYMRAGSTIRFAINKPSQDAYLENMRHIVGLFYSRVYQRDLFRYIK